MRRHVFRQLAGLIGWLLVTAVAAIAGGLASMNAAAFYAQLARPGWAPPAWIFGPAWTLLYALMAIAAWLVWRRRGFAGAHRGLSLFLVQLVFNALWSWLFFAWHLGGLAFGNILVLWCLIVATMIHFWRVSKPAGILLVPYLGWVTFALALNYSVWQRNPDLL